MSHIRNLRITVVVSAVAMTAAFAPNSQAAVCNQAGNGHLGGDYVSIGTPDPTPPARHKSGLKTLGNGKGSGLDRAAERSPALSACGLPQNGGGGGGSTVVDPPPYIGAN